MTEWVEAGASVDWLLPLEEHEGSHMEVGEYGITFGEVCVYGKPEDIAHFVSEIVEHGEKIKAKAAGPLTLDDFDPDNDYACPRCDWSCEQFSNLGELVALARNHIASHAVTADEEDRVRHGSA